MKFNIGRIMVQKSTLCVLLLLIASFLISCTAKKTATDFVSNSEEIVANDYIFTIKDGTVEIASYKGDATELIIPSNIKYQEIIYSVTSIGSKAFYLYEKLAKVIIPDSITHIDGNAFSHCNNLTAIIVTPNNSVYTQVDGILFTKDKKRLHIFPEKKAITSYVIPDGTMSIGDWAFSGCSKLESVTIPDSVTSIGELAFLGCYSLPFVIIPDSVTFMEKEAFLLDYHIPFLRIVVSQGSYAHDYAEENHVPYSLK